MCFRNVWKSRLLYDQRNRIFVLHFELPGSTLKGCVVSLCLFICLYIFLRREVFLFFNSIWVWETCENHDHWMNNTTGKSFDLEPRGSTLKGCLVLVVCLFTYIIFLWGELLLIYHMSVGLLVFFFHNELHVTISVLK